VVPGRSILSALAGALALSGAAACGNVTTSVSHRGNTAGVYGDRIVVGALVSETGPLPADFAPVLAGARAYLDTVNASGGVDGRRIDLEYVLDDQSSPAVDASQARTLVEEDHVFAVVAVATPSFTGGSYLAANNVPSFGLAVNAQWMDGPSLFGNNGSYIGFSSPRLQPVFLAEQLHVRAAAILAYNVAQSSAGCTGVATAFRRYKVPIAYEDLSIPAPATDLHADVTRMKRAGVDMVVSCMDLGGNLLLSQTMQQEGLTGVAQYWSDGYDESALAQYGAAMQGVYFAEANVPFEVSRLYPGRYPGMDAFQAALSRYEHGTMPSEAALAGWTSANLFVDGLRAVGRDVTRSRLVAAINKMSSFTADGILAPVDWRSAHSGPGPLNCAAFVQVRGKRFVPVFGTPPSVFQCMPVPAPAGPPVRPLVPLPKGVPPT
jgi:ABC-type branched-subunit amino acid transport system substrate-binding protein